MVLGIGQNVHTNASLVPISAEVENEAIPSKIMCKTTENGSTNYNIFHFKFEST